jgi:hypothetical protein
MINAAKLKGKKLKDEKYFSSAPAQPGSVLPICCAQRWSVKV